MNFARALTAALLCLLVSAKAEETRAFRRDGGDEKLPWFQLKGAEFPPEGSAHYIAGELIALDHVNRTGVLRPDRTDAQRRGDWDLPLSFTLLPFGSIRYHGAPAELRDIPIGTHLHGQFYLEDPPPKGTKPKPSGDLRVSAESAFSRALKLEDDFSYSQAMQRAWRVDGVDLEKGTLTVTGITAGKEDAKATVFQIAPSTEVYKGRTIASLADLAPGQLATINLTVCTLKGPGRAVSIWIDPESRDVATAHQLEVHRRFVAEHGLAGVIDGVDNEGGIVSVFLFDGFDPKLEADFPINDSVTAAVAEENLRTWDQINDRKSGPIVAVDKIPSAPGNSGLRVKFKPALLLEGFRPGRVIRLWCSKWKVDDLPREERLYN